jgi:DNA polymerase-3 subunit alpha
MDFQDDRREEAIKYVTKKYGPGHVAQIISFGTMGAKASIRDSGRALGIPLADADRLARLIPTKLGITLQDAWDETPELQAAVNADPGLRRLFDTARGLEGVVRHSSTHAAAVVISQEPLVDHVPLQRPTKGDESGVAMTQYPMGPVAKLGLLKMDFLGLINYSILSNALKLIKKHQDIEFRLPDIKFDDQATYDLLASAETASVFQLESAGMRRHIKELKPGSLAELAAMVALYRPGPMEHIGRFIDSKFGKVPIEYPHPALEEILEETYGVIVYQDQVLHILRKFAGYTLGSADIVRKAMGKKDANLMAQERAKFLAGAEEQGYDNVIAGQVFDLIEPFAGYAFNKAHSVCYAVVAYWTAYFKANYPVEYMTCVLNAYEGNAEKMAATIAECARLDISILPPSVNHSEVRFSVDTMTHDKRAIRFGLGNIKGVGDQAVQELVTERVDGGAFKTLEDFGRRAGSNAANRRVIEALAKVGALDMFGNRASLLASVDSITHLLQSEARLKDSGQSTMFDLFGASVPTPLADIELVDAPELGAREVALWERDLLGISLTTRVLDPRHAPDGAILSREQLNEISENEKVMLVGMVTGVRLQSDKNQRRIAFVTLEIFDGSSVDVAVWSKTYEQTSSLWADSSLVQMKGPVRFRNDERSVHCDEAIAYELPEGADELPAQFPVHEPRMEQWVAPTAPPSLAEAPLDQAESDHEPEQMPDQVAKERLEPVGSMATPMPPSVAPEPTPSALKPSPAPNGPSPISAGQAYVGPPSTPADSNGYANSGMPTQPMRRKLLINMTETDRPDEDQMLLREVLQTLLDYPGTDAVDLLITSEGRNWRLEMPIITTGFCPALETRIHDLLERPDAITIADGAPVAVS